MSDSDKYELLSASTVAERLGVTIQTVYNQIKAHMWDVVEFQRGKNKGILIKYPKQ